MSIAMVLKISLAEKQAKKIIEDAQIKAQQLIDDAKLRAKYYLSDDYINSLVERYIEEAIKKLKVEEVEVENLSEELELLTSISEDDLKKLAKKIVEVIINESIG